MAMKELQFGHSAYFKNKKDAVIFAKATRCKVKKTNHKILRKGYLAYR